jgi:hypothetical protein
MTPSDALVANSSAHCGSLGASSFIDIDVKLYQTGTISGEQNRTPNAHKVGPLPEP